MNRGATDGDDTNNQDYFEKAFEKAKDEYEKNLEKDEFSRKLFNKLTEEIIANNEHKEMLIDCITKKREQVNRVLSYFLLLIVYYLDCFLNIMILFNILLLQL